MGRPPRVAAAALLVFSSASIGGLAQSAAAGWTIREDALTRKSPAPASPVVIAQGKQLYDEHCSRCHGPTGRGDGRDGDPDGPPRDLTDSTRVDRNPDGVVFDKIWNGRREPRMPTFREEGLSEAEVWALVAYIQTLRRRGPEPLAE